MTDNDKKRLMEITAREAAEFGTMAAVISKKHDSISKLDTASIQNIVGEELGILNRIRAVERERAELLKAVGLDGNDLTDVNTLERELGHADALNYQKLQDDFRKIFSRVIQLNNISRVLLVHSLGFIKQNIRILTDDGRRKLVDKRA